MFDVINNICGCGLDITDHGACKDCGTIFHLDTQVCACDYL